MPSELVEWLLVKHTKPTNKGALKVGVLSPGLKIIKVVFDDQNLVANAGLLAIATLSQSLELQESIEDKGLYRHSCRSKGPLKREVIPVQARLLGPK